MSETNTYSDDDVDLAIKSYAMANARAWMLHYWGERCPEYIPGCIVCDKWDQFDQLFSDEGNPERLASQTQSE